MASPRPNYDSNGNLIGYTYPGPDTPYGGGTLGGGPQQPTGPMPQGPRQVVVEREPIFGPDGRISGYKPLAGPMPQPAPRLPAGPMPPRRPTPLPPARRPTPQPAPRPGPMPPPRPPGPPLPGPSGRVGSATGATPNIGGFPTKPSAPTQTPIDTWNTPPQMATYKKGGQAKVGKVKSKAPVKKAMGGKVAAKPMGKPVMKKAGGRVAAKPMAKGRKR